MDLISGLALLLDSLAGLARQRNQGDLADRLNIIGDGLVLGTATHQELKAMREEIETLVASGADPSAEQRAATAAKRDELKARAQAMRDAGNDNGLDD